MCNSYCLYLGQEKIVSFVCGACSCIMWLDASLGRLCIYLHTVQLTVQRLLPWGCDYNLHIESKFAEISMFNTGMHNIKININS